MSDDCQHPNAFVKWSDGTIELQVEVQCDDCSHAWMGNLSFCEYEGDHHE